MFNLRAANLEGIRAKLRSGTPLRRFHEELLRHVLSLWRVSIGK